MKLKIIIYLKGKIKKILLLFLSIKEKDEKLNDNYKLKDFYKNKKDILVKLLENKNIEFQNLFNIYKELDLNKNKIWGELLLEDDVYKSNKNYIWLISNEEYAFFVEKTFMCAQSERCYFFVCIRTRR